MTMRVHQELSVPSKAIRVWMMPEHQHAEQRAGDVAHAAGEQGAADHHGGDGVELQADGVQAVAREHVEGEHHAGQRRAEAR